MRSSATATTTSPSAHMCPNGASTSACRWRTCAPRCLRRAAAGSRRAPSCCCRPAAAERASDDACASFGTVVVLSGGCLLHYSPCESSSCLMQRLPLCSPPESVVHSSICDVVAVPGRCASRPRLGGSDNFFCKCCRMTNETSKARNIRFTRPSLGGILTIQKLRSFSLNSIDSIIQCGAQTPGSQSQSASSSCCDESKVRIANHFARCFMYIDAYLEQHLGSIHDYSCELHHCLLNSSVRVTVQASDPARPVITGPATWVTKREFIFLHA